MALSTHDEYFLRTARTWLAERGDLFVMLRLAYAGGQREYRFVRSEDDLMHWMDRLPSRTSVIIFRQPQLMLRGRVEDSFMAQAVECLSNEVGFVLHTPDYRGELAIRIEGCGLNREGGGYPDLIEYLDELRGEWVAIGPDPPWLKDTEDVLGAYTPDIDGVARPGAY
jgi:hypothetical protein